MSLKQNEIRVIEVGPRDGLQNERTPIPTDVKLRFISSLVASGIEEIEATSFVSPKWVPQLADACEVVQGLSSGPKFSALVPNSRGLTRALECGVNRIAVFTAASEAFTKKNINMSIKESIDEFESVIRQFRAEVSDGWVRAYVSTAFECPYAGRIPSKAVCDVVERVLELGIDELSIGDTLGVAAPKEVESLTRDLLSFVSPEKLCYHFHDTYGLAVANTAQALEMGVTSFDSSAGGLGGCPYAPGATGNMATEDLVYFALRTGIPCSIDLDRLANASLEILESLGRRPQAKAQVARLALASETCPK